MVTSERERLRSECGFGQSQHRRPTVTTAILFAVISLAGGSCASSAQGGDAASSEPTAKRGTVDRIIDGDTVDVNIGGRVERVRLLGIDTPESVARTVPDQCFGAEASLALAELIPPGTELDLSRDLEARDRYGRLLLYLHRRSDGLFVNQWMVESGYAETLSYEPNTTYRSILNRAQRTAIANGVGLWAQCDGPNQPLDPVRPR